jgi:hypothetical protein
MDRVIGGVLGLCAGITVVVVSAMKGIPVTHALWRSALAVLAGYWIGKLIFGPAGLSVVKEAAGPVPPEPPPAAEGKPPAPGAPAGPKAK